MKIQEFDVYRLIVFYHVAKEKSVTEAANKLFLTQPAVTSHIKTLERITNLKLIENKKQRITLTPVGEGLYQYAKEIYEQSILANRFVELMRNSSFNIGIAPSFNNVIAPVLTTLFEEVHFQTKLTIESKESYYLLSDVLDSAIDLALIATRDEKNPKLTYVPIIDKLQLAFFASPSNSIFKKERIVWEDLCDYPLISGSETSIVKRFTFDKLKLKGLNLELQRGLSIISNNDLKRKLIKNGNFLGVTLLKDIEEDLKNGELRIVPFPDEITMGVNVVGYPNTIKSPIVEKFVSLTIDAFKSWNSGVSG